MRMVTHGKMSEIKNKRFTWYVVLVLAVNLMVILWGAFVRATGSGAGCGSHWPLCNGEVIPKSQQVETVIEFTHRLTSGAAFIFVLIMFVWAFRAFPKRHPARLAASLSLVFIITEALVGAGLVLFEWVAYDTSSARVISMSVHLVNTFLLLAAITLTGWWSIISKPAVIDARSIKFWVIAAAALSVIILGVSGAVTALGDTLYPVESVIEGMREDFNPQAHFLVRMRVFHPIIAVLTGLIVVFSSIFFTTTAQKKNDRLFSGALMFVYAVQLVAGGINLLLLAPVWMQLIHLLLADFVWIMLIITSAARLTPDWEEPKIPVPEVSLATSP